MLSMHSLCFSLMDERYIRGWRVHFLRRDIEDKQPIVPPKTFKLNHRLTLTSMTFEIFAAPTQSPSSGSTGQPPTTLPSIVLSRPASLSDPQADSDFPIEIRRSSKGSEANRWTKSQLTPVATPSPSRSASRSPSPAPTPE